MRCLQFAGIKPVVSAARDAAMVKRNQGDYPANPYGFFEVDERDYMRIGYLDAIEDGMAIKLLPPALPFIPTRPTVVIWMHRDAQEVKASYERVFSPQEFEKKFSGWPRTIDQQVKHIRPILQDRRSIHLFDFDYRDVVADPLKALSVLPIDYQRAVAAVDPALYRNVNHGHV